MKAVCVSLFFVGFIMVIDAKASHIPKCQPKSDDGERIANYLTYLIQRGNELHELNIPKFDPYKFPKPQLFHTTFNPKLPLHFVCCHTDLSIYGFENLKVNQIKGFELNPKMASFEITFFVPEITSIATIEATINLFSINSTSTGFTDTKMKNMEINQTFDCDVIERNGKHYVNIKSVRTKAKFEDYLLKFESAMTISIVTEMINRIANANWRLIFVEIEPHFVKILNKIGQTIVTPIFNKISIQDFFQQNCE